MAAKPPQQQIGGGGGETLAAQIAGMSKNQLFEIMGQMKNMIEQNPQQARQILIDNPKLTKALFQAQIMLGMVQPPKVMPNFQQTPAQPTQQPTQLLPKNLTPAQPATAQSTAIQQPEYNFPSQIPPRQQQQQKTQQPVPPVSFSSSTFPPMPVPPAHHNLPPPLPAYSMLQGHNLGTPPLVQPLQRPSFSHPLQPQIPPGLGLQMPPQSGFHPGGGSSFPVAPPKIPGPPSRQQLYQGASDFNVMPGRTPLPAMASQPPPRPPQLTAEMEQALLQQVMSLTPEQISQLPPEHRQHVLQIQQMYRM
ncbi:hydroxyproline-rich glycoprotein family protein [Wolffia australiana]